ncbi:Uncharacterized membrane protein YfhO [Lachnospiraceae bacterium]|nr:Uncharacterized membrane protein YfhO [Lachnospiraceae bacterium]
MNENKSSNKLVLFINDNKVYFITILITSLLYTIFVVLRNCVPFGEYSAIVSDGYVISYPSIFKLIEDTRLLKFPIIDYSNGFCLPNSSLHPLLFFMNPLRIMLLFFPDRFFLFGYQLFYAFEFVLIGPSIIFYMTKRLRGMRMDKHNLLLVPIALSYNLSAFVICYYSFWSFLDIVILLPLIILSMERLVYEKKYRMYIVLLSIYIIDSTYYAFLLCEFLILIFFTFEHESFKDFIRNGIRFAVSSIYSAGIAFFALIPFYNSAFNSAYVNSDAEKKSIINYLSHDFINSFNDFEIYRETLVTSDDWTKANTYCGILLILIIPVFLQMKSIKLSTRIKRVALLVLLFISYSNQLLNYVFHGFHFQSLVPNRFSVFFIFVLVIILYDVLNDYEVLFEKKSIILCFISGLVLMVLFVIGNDTQLPTYVITDLFIVLYLIVFILGYLSKNYKVIITAVMICLMAELVIASKITVPGTSGYLSISPNTTVTMKKMVKSNGLDKNPFVRTEFLNKNNFNSAELINTSSSSILSSTLQQEIINLVYYWNVISHANNVEYLAGNPLSNIMLGEKYFFLEDNSGDVHFPSYYVQKDRIGDIVLYEDPYVNTGLNVFPDTFSEIDIDDYENVFDYQNTISGMLIDSELYTIIDPQIDLLNKQNEESTFVDIFIPKDIKGDIYLSYDNSLEYLGKADGKSLNELFTLIKFKDTPENERKDKITIAVLNEEALSELSEKLKEYQITDYKVDDNIITINTDSLTNGNIYISLPKYQSWKAYLDDSECAIDKRFGGMSVKVPAGKHTVKIIYNKQNNYPGIIISIVFILGLVLFTVMERNKTKRDKQIEDKHIEKNQIEETI